MGIIPLTNLCRRLGKNPTILPKKSQEIFHFFYINCSAYLRRCTPKGEIFPFWWRRSNREELFYRQRAGKIFQGQSQDDLLKAVGELGYERPTPVQEQAIPFVMAGKDVIGSAPNRHRQDRRLRASYPAAPAVRTAKACPS
jgi:hypothetical protein